MRVMWVACRYPSIFLVNLHLLPNSKDKIQNPIFSFIFYCFTSSCLCNAFVPVFIYNSYRSMTYLIFLNTYHIHRCTLTIVYLSLKP